MRHVALGLLPVIGAAVFTGVVVRAAQPPAGEAPLPPAREIPGITTPDAFPQGCVGCHVNLPERNLDTRLSVLMGQWTEGKVSPTLLEKARAAAPPGVTLKGRHPAVPKALEDIPAACLACHGEDSRVAPPFVALSHLIHLTGGDENHFLTLFGGECTHCHKLDPDTGRWSIPSGPEPSRSQSQ